MHIDYWSEKHNEEDQIMETFKGKIKMKNFSEQKYLGFIISDDGTNIKNILAKEKKAHGIKCEIQYLINGQENILLRAV